MARIDQGTKSNILQFAGNGANRPLHQDRQVLRAGDLALEQATQDAMLARARRYLHGWGVVEGFMPTTKQDADLSVGPGYGVTPLGDELFLPEDVTLKDIVSAVLKCCGPGPLGCEVIDVKQRDEASKVSEEQSVTDVLGKVSAGEADAGLVYVTDVEGAGGAVQGVPFPEASAAVNTYPVAALKDSRHPALAAAFVQAVTGEQGHAALAAAGFGRP